MFDPAQHLSGISFATYIEKLDWSGLRVLDLGTGTGLLAAVLHDHGADVVATDRNPRAARCAAENVAGTAIDVRCGDLFETVAGERFHTIVVNPPYERGWSISHNLRSPNFLDRLAEQWPAFSNRLILAFPTDAEDVLADAGLDLQLVERLSTTGRELGIFTAVAA